MDRPPMLTQDPAEYFAALVREALDPSLDLGRRAEAANTLGESLWPCLVDVQVEFDRKRERERIAARAAQAAQRRQRGLAEVVPLRPGPNARW